MSCRRRFPTIALVTLLALLAAAGCRRKRSTHVTNVQAGIFTTDDFPGASVQDGNVADDKRAFSEPLPGFTGDVFCTHNGDRGTMMVSYCLDRTVYSHYYDGGRWTPPVALRHFDHDAKAGATAGPPPVVHAFINTADDSRSAARDRDGDCLIFWTGVDADSDGAGPDDNNRVLFVSSFDVTYADDPEMNYGFDVNPATPGVFEARRMSVPDSASEDVSVVGLATDGLCGEARWTTTGASYRYGDETTGIEVFWQQLTQKWPGEWDETTEAAAFDLGAGTDPAVPLVPTVAAEIPLLLFGASDTGSTARESAVKDEYASYNGVMFRRVRTAGGTPAVPPLSHGWADTIYDFGNPSAPGEDVTLQATHFNLLSGSSTTSCVNTVLPDSTAGNVDNIWCDFVRETRLIFFTPNNYFLDHAGEGIYGRDEGLSCLVTFFGEVSTPDNTVVPVWNAEGGEGAVALAEMDEATGALLSTTRMSVNDPAASSNCKPSTSLSTRISRNGDYIWAAWVQEDLQGAWNDYELFAAQYLTTRVDEDGLPQPVPPVASSVGLPLSISDGVQDPYPLATVGWYEWQDNLGYVCGQQSDAAAMNLFFCTQTTGLTDDLIYHVRLGADVDGAVGGETASAPFLLVTEEAAGLHGSVEVVNNDRSTFNATDAGRDGDILYVFFVDGDETDGAFDPYLFAGRIGVTACPPVEIGSKSGNRQCSGAEPLRLVSTPAGSEIGAWDTSASAYESEANHGPDFVHVLFQEAETGSPVGVPTSVNTLSGFALRTRVYRCNGADSTLGDDLTPSAGSPFFPPFDVDLPFVDPDTTYDAEVWSVSTCDNTVAIVFKEEGHVYYQECTPSGDELEVTGWRQKAPGVSDPALVDDADDGQPVEFDYAVCSPTCTCCTVDGTAIFWTKPLDALDSGEVRLHVRVVDHDR